MIIHHLHPKAKKNPSSDPQKNGQEAPDQKNDIFEQTLPALKSKDGPLSPKANLRHPKIL